MAIRICSQMWCLFVLIYLAITTVCSGQVPIDPTNVESIAEDVANAESVELMIHQILTQLRNTSATTLPGFDIPDPMPIDDFDTVVNQGMTTADVQLWNVSIEGLSKFVIDHVSAQLGRLSVDIGMNLTDLKTKGQYDLVGKFSFFRLTGNGAFYMTIGQAYVSGDIYLNHTDDGGLHVERVQLDITVTDIKLNFENLLGGGVMSTFTNTIINTLSKVIFDSVKPTVLEEMQNTVRMVLNEQFQNLPPQPRLGTHGLPLDLVFANTATQIRQNNLDPFQLPDQKQSFNRRILFVKVHGDVHMDSGYLRGLSSLHRTGEVMMTFKDNVLEVSAELGFSRLEGGYRWTANFMGINRKGGVHFFVNGIQLMFNATQSNAKGAHPQLTNLEIKQIRLIGVDVDGLGSLDFLIEFFSNFLTNVFKKQFSRILETSIKTQIQDNLNQIQLPF